MSFLMRYKSIEKAVFLNRPNRFIARVLLNEREVVCHVKNTGRCRELLVPGAEVWLEGSDNPNRKTAWDLVAVEKAGKLINMDAQAPNRVFGEWAARQRGVLAVHPEVLLMDEPTSALDPISTSKVEDLVLSLKKEYTIIIVTHNMQQATRVSDRTAFFLLGEVVEYAETEQLFSKPQDKRTEDYISGRFG